MMQHAFPATRHGIIPSPSSSREWAARHRQLVEEIARNLIPRLPRFVETEDLIQMGFIGLLEAEQQYHGPQAGFPKFARPWIRSAMLQEVPADHVGSRRLQRILRHFEERSQALEQSLGRAPKSVEFAAANGLTIEAYQSLRSEHYVMRAGLTKAAANPQRDLRETAHADPLQAALQLCDKRCLRRAFRKLTSRERRMLRMHYEAGIKLKAIGQAFDVTESRVCQILSHALARLRAELS